MNICFPVQSFKGTLEAIHAYNIAKNSIKRGYVFPISDGGDGFLDVIHYVLKKGTFFRVKTINANGKNIFAKVYKYKNNYYIESANIIGVKKIKENSNVLNRSSKGLGTLLKKIYNKNSNYYIGLGGSAIIDIGGEMLETLGCDVEYYKRTKIAKSVIVKQKYNNFHIISDVENILNSKNGAIVYAKQKGVKNMYRMLKRFNEFSQKHRIENIKYLGSAGGLGAAFFLLGARFINNFSFFDKLLKIKENINKSDTVIVCEGHFDRQSFYGKINGNIINYALKQGKKVFVITGKSYIKRKNITIIKMNNNAIIRPKYYFKKALVYLLDNYNIVKT